MSGGGAPATLAARQEGSAVGETSLCVDGFLTVGAAYGFAVPLDPAVVGARFSAQGFVLQPAGAPCLDQIQLSDTIDVTIG